MVRIVVNGAAGRMGRRLIVLAGESQDLQVVGAMEHAGHPLLGQDAGVVAGVAPIGIRIATEPPASLDVLIDFSAPPGTRTALAACLARGAALAIGTTGLSAEDLHAIEQAGAKIPVLQAPNMSLGVNLLFALAGQVARQLGSDYDIEITEAHHRFKKDAPSGTALGLAKAICDATGRDPDRSLVHGRHGDAAARPPGQIGMHALRMGDVVGRHTVSFATLGEELHLTHNATSRDVFARGALRAARWLAGKPPARYSMKDVLGL
jgi:4-hydroxy-tetrahydrodipicolinate reductase